jgi:tRNA A-37 threonylcarbamoyl transferase component Bud32
LRVATAISYFAALNDAVSARTENNIFAVVAPAATVAPDSLDLSAIPSVAVSGHADRVLADIDQDGFVFARHLEDERIFNTRFEYLPRERCTLQIVLSRGAVRLRKRYRLGADRRLRVIAAHYGRLYFLTELAALKQLQQSGCAPRLLRADLSTLTIEMEYIAGLNLRHMLARTHTVLDHDLRGDAALCRVTGAERVEREFRLCAAILSKDLKREILAVFRRVHACGVIPRDVHLANIIIGRDSGKPYLVDFELSYLGAAASPERAVQSEELLARKLKIDTG